MKNLNVTVVVLALILVSCNGQKQAYQLKPEDRVAFASQAFTSVVRTANDLIESGVIKDQKTKDVIFYTAREGHRALEDARANVNDVDKLDYALRRVASAMDTLSQIWSKK